jgi:tripartite-type tricarboxylate transporter receptor subunit TctC
VDDGGRGDRIAQVTVVRVIVALALLAAALAAGIARAEDYPARPVRVMIGFGPGSAADISARVIGARMSQLLGQQFVVEPRPGGGSNIAAEFVSRSPKDGYTLLLGNVANTVSAALATNPSFDFGKDLAPVARLTAVPVLLAGHPSVGASDLKGLVAVAKDNPGQIFYGSSGVGTAAHLAGELLNVTAGVRLVHVPYPGSAQALIDLLAGRIQLSFGAASTALAHVAQGKLVAYGMAQPRRASLAPTIPTLAEQGLEDFDASLWFGLMAPAGTPREIVDKLARAANDAIRADEVIKALHAQGVDLLGGSPEEFSRTIENDIKRWTTVATAAGLRK